MESSFWFSYLRCKLAYSFKGALEVVLHYRLFLLLFVSSIFIPPEVWVGLYQQLIQFQGYAWPAMEVLGLGLVLTSLKFIRIPLSILAFEKSLPVPWWIDGIYHFVVVFIAHLPLILCFLIIYLTAHAPHFFTIHPSLKDYSPGWTELKVGVVMGGMILVHFVLFYFGNHILRQARPLQDYGPKGSSDESRLLRFFDFYEPLIHGFILSKMPQFASSLFYGFVKGKVLWYERKKEILFTWILSLLLWGLLAFVLLHGPEIPKPRIFLSHLGVQILFIFYSKYFRSLERLDEIRKAYLFSLPLKKRHLVFSNFWAIFFLMAPLGAMVLGLFLIPNFMPKLMALFSLILLFFVHFPVLMLSRKLFHRYFLMMAVFYGIFTSALLEFLA